MKNDELIDDISVTETGVQVVCFIDPGKAKVSNGHYTKDALLTLDALGIDKDAILQNAVIYPARYVFDGFDVQDRQLQLSWRYNYGQPSESEYQATHRASRVPTYPPVFDIDMEYLEKALAAKKESRGRGNKHPAA
jgi:hypothetical protein